MSEKWKNLCAAAVMLSLLVFTAAIFRKDEPERGLVTFVEQTTSAVETTESASPAATTKPTRQTTTQPPPETTTTTRPVNYDLNTAEADDLMHVSGIGEVLAERILAYRSSLGGFTRREQLREIQGIGDTLAAAIMAEFYIPGELPPETVPPVEPTPDVPQDVPQTTAPEPGHYDVNRVTREELLLLPGMTEALADGILTLRQNIGAFRNMYELLLVPGMTGDYFQNTLLQYLSCETE